MKRKERKPEFFMDISVSGSQVKTSQKQPHWNSLSYLTQGTGEVSKKKERKGKEEEKRKTFNRSTIHNFIFDDRGLFLHIGIIRPQSFFFDQRKFHVLF